MATRPLAADVAAGRPSHETNVVGCAPSASQRCLGGERSLSLREISTSRRCRARWVPTRGSLLAHEAPPRARAARARALHGNREARTRASLGGVGRSSGAEGSARLGRGGLVILAAGARWANRQGCGGRLHRGRGPVAHCIRHVVAGQARARKRDDEAADGLAHAIAHEGRLCRPDSINEHAAAPGGGREGGLAPFPLMLGAWVEPRGHRPPHRSQSWRTERPCSAVPA